MSRALVAFVLALLAVPATAAAARLETDRACYISGQSMAVVGSEWAPGSAYNVFGAGINESGVADSEGAFAFGARAPEINRDVAKPRSFTLTGTQDNVEVATARFQVVNFRVAPRDISGKPTGKTSWAFSGFLPGKRIFMHVKRGKKVWTQKVGKGSRPCGTLRKRLRRLPAVPARRINFGTYKVFVDNRRKFSTGGLQYRARITIERR